MLLCVGVSLIARVLDWAERYFLGQAWIETLVLAIVIGAVLRAVWTPGERWRPGIGFCATTMLEVAVVMLGAQIDTASVLKAGPTLLIGVVTTVAVGLGVSYGVSRGLGLPPRMATLVACGNSICGNSAIVAVAPIIGAKAQEVGSAIAFTALLGVVVVLGLPFLIGLLALSKLQYGILAGLTVYAVPQVLAATAPAGAAAVQIGTLVKLMRVLMLGPVVLMLSLIVERTADRSHHGPMTGTPISLAQGRPSLRRLVPWFIVGFLLLAAARALDLMPQTGLAPIANSATVLTVLSMAALGLGTEVRGVARAGLRVAGAVTLSLVALGIVGFSLIHILGVA